MARGRGVAEIKAEIQQLEDELAEKQRKALAELVEEVRARARELGVDLEEVVATLKPKKRKKRQARWLYTGPDGRTWNGIGPRPAWVKGEGVEKTRLRE